MIGIPINANSVYISMVQTGCCKGEFDSTYPVHLNGIISQHEFQESVNNINQSFVTSRQPLIFIVGLFILTTIGSIICYVVGGMTASRSYSYGFPALTGVGMGLSIVGTVIFVFGMIIIGYKRTSRLRRAVAEESVKYSRRSTPCSWRLETSRYFYGGYGNNNTRVSYHLIIDIGTSLAPGSSTYYSNPGNEQSYLTQQQNNYGPPPYSGPSTGFCSKCGVARSDSSARFCSSCGQAFNKY